MAKAKAIEAYIDETVVDTAVDTVVATEEVTPPLLNEAVPEKEAPGHHSRDFSA
jgi:hypothetical protein